MFYCHCSKIVALVLNLVCNLGTKDIERWKMKKIIALLVSVVV